MRLIYTVIKQKLDYINKVSATIAESSKRMLVNPLRLCLINSSNGTTNIISLIKQVHNQIQGNSLQNVAVKSARWVKDLMKIITPVPEVISTIVNAVSIVCPPAKPAPIVWDVFRQLLEGI